LYPILTRQVSRAIIPPSLVANQRCSSARKEALLVMRSSAAVAGRAFIMLACVVAIPTLALWGTSWSEVVKRLQDFRWPQNLDFLSASTSASPDDPPRGTPANPVVATTPSVAGRSTLAEGPSPRGPASTPAASQTQALAATQSAVVPIEYQAPAELCSVPAPIADPAGQNAKAADPFHAIQERLRQLGATYYLLESWGNQQQMYRFYCKMAVGGSAQYARCFEATHTDPLQSMVEVLQQVEAWRKGSTKAEKVE
jgi:hypothetical protein